VNTPDVAPQPMVTEVLRPRILGLILDVKTR
jgi:hypothetical protein